MFIIRYLGKAAIFVYLECLFALMFFCRVLHAIILEATKGRRAVRGVLIMQIYFTGVQALPVVGLLAVIFGASISFGTAVLFQTIGASAFVESVLCLIIVREFGPLIVATIILVRSGTAVAAELATMSINDEVSALRSMSINPYRFLVVPRLFGFVISAVCLSLYFAAIAFVAGSVSAACVSPQQCAGLFITMATALRSTDLVWCVLKSAIFGAIISLTSTYYGLSAKRLPAEIPQLTTKATVAGFFWCLVAGSIITAFTFRGLA